MLKTFYYKVLLRCYFRLLRLIGAVDNKSIALVVNAFDKGGLEQVVLNLYKGYKKRGYKVYLLVQQRIVGELALNLDHYSDLFIFDGDEYTFFNFIKTKGIGVLHYHYNTFMMERARAFGLKLLYTVHNAYTWMSEQQMGEHVAALKNCNAVVAVSSFTHDYLVSRAGNVLPRFLVQENGIDTEELKGDDGDFLYTREKIGIGQGDITLGFIASFFPTKHQFGALGAMEQLVQTHPHIKLLLVGNVGDTAYFNAFKQALEHSPAKQNIIVMPYFEHKYMGRFLEQTVDIFILPTLQEGCSNAVLEAVCCAKPMVLTNTGNAKDVQAKGASCIVVEAAYESVFELNAAKIAAYGYEKNCKNTAALAAAIAEIADNFEEYNAKAVAAQKLSAVYSAEGFVDGYLDIIKSL